VEPLKILVVDDHELVRVGLRAIIELESDLRVVGEAKTGEEAVQRAKTLRPNVVLMDIRMPGLSGIEACRQVRALLPDTKVLMLTTFKDDEAVLSSIMAGASGFVLKDIDRVQLVNAVRAVEKGESLLDPAVTKKVLDRLTGMMDGSKKEKGPLSEREKEVLGYLARGYTNKEIAEKLFLSDRTVRNHVSHILQKLNLSRRAEAAAYAARRGIMAEES